MPNIAALRIDYSFAANRRAATDRVNATQLDATLAAIVAKVNEVVAALDETLRDDDTLDDAVIQPRHLNEEVITTIASMVQAEVAG